MLVDHRDVENSAARDDDQVENLLILVGCFDIEWITESQCNERSEVGKEVVGAVVQANWPRGFGDAIVFGSTAQF